MSSPTTDRTAAPAASVSKARGVIVPSTLLVFSKIPGQAPCKTRLQNSAPLSSAQIELLATAFLFDTLASAQAASPERLVVATDPASGAAALAALAARFGLSAPELPGAVLVAQQGDGFGQKLQNACLAAHTVGSSGVVVIGSDAPTISADCIAQSLQLVSEGTAVVGPTSSGGMYLIGIPASAFESSFSLESLFDGGSSQTELELFAEAVRSADLELVVLPPQFDIDVHDDLVTLLGLLPVLSAASSSRGDSPTSRSYAALASTRAAIARLGLRLSRDSHDNRSWRVICA